LAVGSKRSEEQAPRSMSAASERAFQVFIGRVLRSFLSVALFASVKIDA
jgi:hypothetical protein